VTPMEAFTNFSDKAVQQIKSFVKLIDEKLLSDYSGSGRITITLGQEAPVAGVKEAVEVIYKRSGWTAVVWEITNGVTKAALLQSYDAVFEKIVNEHFPEHPEDSGEKATKKKRESKW